MTSQRITKWLQQGVRLHQEGRLADAEEFYNKALKVDGANPDALNLKGMIAAHAGHHTRALQLYDRAVSAYPDFADAYYNKAATLTALGRLEEALACYTTAIRANPHHLNAHLNAGAILHELRRHDEAITMFRQMTSLSQADVRGFFNLGSCLLKTLPAAPQERRADIVNEAIGALTRACKLAPSNPEVSIVLAEAFAARGEYASAIEQLRSTGPASEWPAKRRAETLSTLGEYLRKDGQLTAAVETHRSALTLQPDHPLIEYNLAATLGDAKQFDEAEVIYKRIIARQPDFVKALVNLGNIYRENNRHDEAMALFERAIAIEPTPQAYANIAVTFGEIGWLSTSLMLHNKAMALGPRDAAARHNHAMALLAIGQLKSGWEEYDARFTTAHVGTPPRARPTWQGEALAGKRILVWMEEGAGDQILHASMIPDLIACGGHVLIECLARLAPVFARSFPGSTIIERHHPTDAAAEHEVYDYQIAAGSLGRYFRPDFASFPKHAGYLKAAPAQVASFRRTYEKIAAGRRIIGIAWRSRNPDMGQSKSASLANFGAILQQPGFLFVNLQYGDCAADIADARSRFGVEIFQDPNVDQLSDMDSFFAQVGAMDGVVSTSNTAVHVAASQNIPTQLMLPYGKGAIWYWFYRRSDSPWYPAVTIERALATHRDEAWEIDPARRIAASLAHSGTPGRA